MIKGDILKKDYSIVFCDIDGTLLNSKHQITDKVKKKICEIYNNGVKFILTSARMPTSVHSFLNQLEIKSPYVCYSGSMILGEDREVLRSAGIPLTIAKDICDCIKDKYSDIVCTTYYKDEWIASETDNRWVQQEKEITGMDIIQAALSDIKELTEEVNKLMCMGEAAEIEAAEKDFRELYPELHIYRSKHTYL